MQSGLALAERAAYREFGDAVVAFAGDPGPFNLARYVAASRALEDARRALRGRAPKSRRTRRATVAAPAG
jgi:hypothetical protein